MKALDRVVDRTDQGQQHDRVAAPTYAVIKKFGDDQANDLVVGLGWYGFTSIYPLLLVVVTIFGFVGAASLGNGIVSTLHQFPVIGSEFNPAKGSSRLHGNVAGLVVGLVLLVYGAQGVTQTAQRAMAKVWDIPKKELPGFLARLGRSIGALVVIGGSFVANAALGAVATAGARTYAVRVPVILAMVVINILSYAVAFRVLTPKAVRTRSLLPGAIAAAIGFTALITVGSGLVAHQIRNSSETYGQFAVVIGLVGFLLILAKISMYAAELNVVLDRHLWPRPLREDKKTDAPAERVDRDLELSGAPDDHDATGALAGVPGGARPWRSDRWSAQPTRPPRLGWPRPVVPCAPRSGSRPDRPVGRRRGCDAVGTERDPRPRGRVPGAVRPGTPERRRRPRSRRTWLGPG